MSVDIKQTTIFVTVPIQHGFENNPIKMTITRKIYASRILINKFSFRIHVMTFEFRGYHNFVRDIFMLFTLKLRLRFF